VAEGGLAVALAECCLAGAIGAEVEAPPAESTLATLFGEGAGAFVVSGDEAALRGLPCAVTPIGRVGGEALSIHAGELSLEVALADLHAAHESGLARYLR
jgi:phosphoribosylformylglycinamidine synthase subunit PurL